MRKSIESNKHTQIKLLLRFYRVIRDKIICGLTIVGLITNNLSIADICC
jgi:hypothetical protein